MPPSLLAPPPPQPDATAWLCDDPPTPPEASMRVLTVPDASTTIINGALPSGFDEGHNPRFWVLEFIAKVNTCSMIIVAA